MERPAELIDREKEWKKLSDLWASDRADLVFVHGRRRVGKSWLLQRFADAAGGVYFQATRGTRAAQVGRLSQLFGEHFGDDAFEVGAGLLDWESHFEYVSRRAGDDPFLLVIDEFPYLAEESSELSSIIQHFRDHPWKSGGTFKLVLCGSHITLMKRLEGSDQPLHGRRTARLALSPFTYRQVPKFAGALDARDAMMTYGIFGGLAGNLDQLDPDVGLADNVCRLLLDPSSRLYDGATHVLDSFGSESDVHYATLGAIAAGERIWSGITKRVARSSGALLPVLEWLRDMELVQREVPVTKDQPQKSKTSIYRVTDPYLRFWYRFMLPIYSSGSAGIVEPTALWKSRIEPHLDDLMGETFEDICRDYVRDHVDLGFDAYRIGRWWTRDSTEEVDVVVRGLDDELFVAECKWDAVTGADLKKLTRRASQIASLVDAARPAERALFTGSGEFDDAVAEARKAGDVAIYGPQDLFEKLV